MIDGQKLGTDGITMLANVLKTNQGLRVLHLKNVGATKDSISQLFDAMAQNRLLNLADIDVSNNNIEVSDKTKLFHLHAHMCLY